MKKITFINAVLLIFFFIDRFLKLFFHRAGHGFLFFKNPYLALGVPCPKNILIILIIFILFFLIRLLINSYLNKNIFLIFSLTLIILGTINNLIDRLFYGYVIDYINIPLLTIFNLADMMVAGGIMMIVCKYLARNKEAKSSASQERGRG